MKSALFVMITGYVLLVLESVWGPVLQGGLVRLDGLVPFVVWLALRQGLPGGLFPILGLGILSESFSSLPTGLYTSAFAGAYLIVRYILEHMLCISAWERIALVVFVSIGVEVTLLTGGGALDLFWPWGITQALLNGLTSPLWFWLFESVEGRFDLGARGPGRSKTEAYDAKAPAQTY